MVTQEHSWKEAYHPVGRFQGADVQDVFIVDEDYFFGNPIICVAKERNHGADSDNIEQSLDMESMSIVSQMHDTIAQRPYVVV